MKRFAPSGPGLALYTPSADFILEPTLRRASMERPETGESWRERLEEEAGMVESRELLFRCSSCGEGVGDWRRAGSCRYGDCTRWPAGRMLIKKVILQSKL